MKVARTVQGKYIFFRLVVATVNASHLNMGEWFLKDLQITLFY